MWIDQFSYFFQLCKHESLFHEISDFFVITSGLKTIKSSFSGRTNGEK